MSRAAVFFVCCKALAEPSLLSPAGFGTLGSFNILQIGSAAPVFRILLYTEGQGLWGGIIQWHYLLFCSKRQYSRPLNSTGAFLPHLQKNFVYWRVQWDEFVILERLRSSATFIFLFAGLFILPATAHGLCIINQQHRGLDVICCCVTFNNCKIKM